MLSFGDGKKGVPLCAAVLPLLYSVAVTEQGTDTIHKFIGKETQPKDGCSFKLNKAGKLYG